MDTTASDRLLDRLGRLHPKLIDLSLDRIIGLLGVLGSPQTRLPPVIHVAGTNGKGSTTAFLKAMLEAAGLRVHVYTSPHLVRFHERISVPGADGISRPMGEDDLVALLERVEAANAGQPMTFFEITTAAAYLAFAEQPADVTVVEVGLGGRFDATNVIDRPALTVITPVSLDHMHMLGTTVAAIAAEKAGIIKRGVPLVMARQTAEAEAVIEGRAAALGAPVIAAGRDFDAYEQNGRLVFQSADQVLDLSLPALFGRHQIGNAATAIAAALALPTALAPNPAAIDRGLTTVTWPARMQRITNGALNIGAGAGDELWLDGAHNEAGGHVLAEALADLDARVPKSCYLIIGMMTTKDAGAFLKPFVGLVRSVVTVPLPSSPEAPRLPADLAHLVEAAGLAATAAADVAAALALIRARDPKPKRIVIAGSLYLAGHVLAGLA
jgi:dihydrofolate synthase / folylpolyglutamate synthase